MTFHPRSIIEKVGTLKLTFDMKTDFVQQRSEIIKLVSKAILQTKIATIDS